MTQEEMTEIFAVMLLAYPRAEMFKGGVKKLAPTIELWTSCTDDIDAWTGRQAVLRLCKTCVYPPTIAEYRAAAEAVMHDIKEQSEKVVSDIRNGTRIWKSTEAMYEHLPPASITRAVIDAMGGPANLYTVHEGPGETYETWRIKDITDTYHSLIRSMNRLPGEAAGDTPRLEAYRNA